jgi:CHAT domain-containing protein
MAGNDEASQRLEVREIAGLDLQHDGLAILSACETALGEQVPGAALISLAAAFSLGGSSSVLASLWRIDDAATRDFMVAFHRALHSGGRVTAVQAAQLALLRNAATAHPYYWAGFVLIGAR